MQAIDHPIPLSINKDVIGESSPRRVYLQLLIGRMASFLFMGNGQWLAAEDWKWSEYHESIFNAHILCEGHFCCCFLDVNSKKSLPTHVFDINMLFFFETLYL